MGVGLMIFYVQIPVGSDLLGDGLYPGMGHLGLQILPSPGAGHSLQSGAGGCPTRSSHFHCGLVGGRLEQEGTSHDIS